MNRPHDWSGKGRRQRRAGAGVASGLAFLLVAGLLCAAVPAQARPRAVPFDFNGDGLADLAVGAPGERLGRTQAGLVEVIYGSRGAGLVAAHSQAWTLRSPGVKGDPTPGGTFGSAIGSGDFDGDSYADLAVGNRGERLGSVHILYGSPSGLTARDQVFTSAQLGQSDYWGGTLTAGDFNGDGRADLAIGTDSYDTEEDAQAGALTVLYGGPSGLTTRNAGRLTKSTPGVAGSSRRGDAFGYRLAAGDINGDGRDELAVGARESMFEGGGVYVLPGTPAGVSASGSQFFGPATRGLVPGRTGLASLGSAVALADFDADGHADLAVGDVEAGPPRSFGCPAVTNCPGLVVVLRGSSRGVLTTGRQLWHLDSPGIPGVAQSYAQFGASLATGDVNGDGRADLAVGTPELGVGDGNDSSGAVSVLHGSSKGLTSTHAQFWTQDSRGLKGHAKGSTYFGAHLRIADFGHGPAADLAIGSVDGAELDGPSDGQVGRVQVLYGSDRGVTTRDQLWSQASPGIAGSREADDLFWVL